MAVNHGVSAASSSSTSNSSSGVNAAGFKVYGSLFRVDARYQFLNPLGKGSYGIVCAARDRETGQCIAIKKISPMAKRTADAKHTLRELLLLQYLGKHPNVITIHNISTNLKDDELYIIMDLMDTDLHRVIQSSQTLSESHIKYFLHQLLRGVQYLHANGVLHRDLKPGNLLLTKTCQLKIADFGLARKLPRHSIQATGTQSTGTERPRSAPAASGARSAHERAPMTEHVVTRWYRAPELMLQPDGLYDQSVDMWSVGCIFAEILGRKPFFPGKNFLHQLTLIFDVLGTPAVDAASGIKSTQALRFLKSLGKKNRVPLQTLLPNASEEAIDLLEKLLEFDPAKRLTAAQALAHPYLQALELKHRGTVDPNVSVRVDFSFDHKNATKMDLRALIIKEVDGFRKALARSSAASNDNDAAAPEDERRERTTSASSSPQPAKKDSFPISARPSSAPIKVALVPAPENNNSSGDVVCGAAGSGMVHSMLRQREPGIQSQQQQQPASAQAAIKKTTTATAAVTIGSNRQRIRTINKPPVPRQTSSINGSTVSNQQDLLSRVISHRPAALETTTEEPGLPSSQSAFSSATLQRQEERKEEASVRQSGLSVDHTKEEPMLIVPQPRSNAATVCSGAPTTATAIAAAIALGERSKALISSLAVSTKTSLSQRQQEKSEVSNLGFHRPECSSPSSSSSSSDSDRESQRIRASLAAAKLFQPLPSSQRVMPAGATRSGARASALDPTYEDGTARPAFVGSTNSLIRAQRSKTGQSLTESANQMLATITRATAPSDVQANEAAATEAVEPSLKPQRSSSQLDKKPPPAAAAAAGKRLTVPKSPKFSVMSWQKKLYSKPMPKGVATVNTIRPS